VGRPAARSSRRPQGRRPGWQLPPGARPYPAPVAWLRSSMPPPGTGQGGCSSRRPWKPPQSDLAPSAMEAPSSDFAQAAMEGARATGPGVPASPATKVGPVPEPRPRTTAMEVAHRAWTSPSSNSASLSWGLPSTVTCPHGLPAPAGHGTPRISTCAAGPGVQRGRCHPQFLISIINANDRIS
jgi:hypothetical protein